MSKEKNNHTEEDEIDLIALAKTLWDGRKFIIRTVLIFMLLGVIVALLSPKEYTASSTMVPQVSDGSSSSGTLSSLASMAGIDLSANSGNDVIPPTLYPKVVQSVTFQLEMMNTPFAFEDVDHPVTLLDYNTNYAKPNALSTIKKYTLGLPFVILGAIKGEEEEEMVKSNGGEKTISLSKEQKNMRKFLSEKIVLNVDDKEGTMVLSSSFHSPSVAAQVAQKAQELLQETITELNVGKSEAQLKFLQERYDDKKEEFEAAQDELAVFRDRNKNVTSAMAQTQLQRLQSNYSLAFNVYSELAKQVETAEFQVKKDTPVFSVINPVIIPTEDNSSGATTLIIWTFLGAVVAVGWIFGKQFFEAIKERWNEEK